MLQKFHHEQIYRGPDFATKLAARHITVCGAGAIGSNIIEGLCRQGVSRLRVIDKDRVESHNLSTQVYEENDVGQLKEAAIGDKMFRAVGLDIEGHHRELTASNSKQLLKGTDLVIDAFDNSASRLILRNYCINRIPCLHAGVADGYGECAWNDVYRVPEDTHADVCDYPLARNLVILISAIACEEIMDFLLASQPRGRSWSVTLKDLKISPY